MSEVTTVQVASAVPTISEFNPYLVPYQIEVISLIRQEYNYNLGPLEILLSGSVGSAKSLLLAHIIATHVILHAGAGVLIGRRVHKDMKNTIWAMLLKHYPYLRNFWNKSDTTIRLPNGSIIYGVSWDKGDYTKFRSYELSLAVIEELTENDSVDMLTEIRARLGRAQGVAENLLICATNPAGPSHPAYTYFMENISESRRVFYSKTADNPFLPPWYIESLKKSLDKKQAMRLLEGLWVEINQERIYYEYEEDRNYLDIPYSWDYKYPLDLMIDFNNSKSGKPMSIGAGQHINGIFHIGKTWIIAGMRTLDMFDELANDGFLDMGFPIIRLFGDSSGRHSDTRANRPDWDLIENFLSNYRPKNRPYLEYELEVPQANPPIKARHNLINGICHNVAGQSRLFIYKDAKDLSKGLRLTQLKKDAKLIEDDSLREQHITTALGYYCVRADLITRDIQAMVIS
jgi:hypothetical protein